MEFYMSYILQVDFPYTGPWGPEMTAAMDGLARSIANERLYAVLCGT